MTALTKEREQESIDSTHSATPFSRLLQWLDDGAETNGERYLEIRQRLVDYFDRRNRPAAELLADETLDRVSRTLEDTGHIMVSPPARYCYVVARFVLLEDVRASARTVPFDDTRTPSRWAARREPEPTEDDGDGRALQCLERCLTRLKTADRDLIVEYYRDAKRQRIDRRRELAARLGITMNALGIRTWRLRANLETCVNGCRKRV